MLITGGGFALYNERVDPMIVQWNSMGLGLIKAAQHKLTHLLQDKLKADGIFVGSIVVLGLVKGSAFDQAGGGLEPAAIAESFWSLYRDRDAITRNHG